MIVAMRGVAMDERESVAVDHPPEPVRVANPDLERFKVSAFIGLGVGAVPFLWVLWDLWSGSISILRTAGASRFYDLQAQAMLHGHLWIPKGKLGIEAFVHDGRQFTYFGIFPSLLRIPFVIFVPGLEGRLGAPSILLAWMFIGFFSTLLLWRTRVLVRGSAPLGRAEATSFGVLLAAITGGSVVVFLGATPWVYHEDMMWSIALTLGSLFALIGVLERPTRGRVVTMFVLMLLSNLNRLSTGWACVLGAVLVAAWFAFGRSTVGQRRWALPVLVAGLVPLGFSCAVNVAKFGVPVGLPMADQVWTMVNLHRRQFLAANGGSYYSPRFLPSTLSAYFQPVGVRFRSVFPFITLPPAPAPTIGNVVLDSTYRTASATTTMPLLLILTFIGAIGLFRRGVTQRLRALRIPLVAVCLPPGIALMWGYIDTRFLADFMPLFILGGIFGLVQLWGFLEGRRPRLRTAAVGAVAALGLFSMVANFGIAVSPTPEFRQNQLVRYVDFQKTIGDLVGHSVSADVVQGKTLPYWAPAEQLFVVGDCSGFYFSTGQTYATIPKQQLQHRTWLPIVETPGSLHRLKITLGEPPSALGTGVPLLTVGTATIWMEPAGPNQVRFRLADAKYPSSGVPIAVRVGRTFGVSIRADVNLESVDVASNRRLVFNGTLSTGGPAQVHAQQSPAVSVVDVTGNQAPNMSLCHSLLKGT